MMKKILLLIFIHAGILLNFCICQDYINSTSRWCFSTGQIDIHTHKIYFEMSVDSEILINDTSYYSIKAVGIDSVFFLGDVYSIDTVEYQNIFLREAGKKFYVRYYTNQEEVLYYNFDLEIGDTIPDNFAEPDSAIIVVGIDTLSSGGLSRKRFITNYNDIQLIEGVCNTRGWRMPDFSIDLEFVENPTGLTSYSINGETIQVDSNRVCIFTPVSTATNIVDSQDLIKVFPNPTRDIIRIDLSLNMNTLLEVSIFNSLGQLVLIDKIDSQGITGVDVRGLGQGIYFLKVGLEGERILHSANFVILD